MHDKIGSVFLILAQIVVEKEGFKWEWAYTLVTHRDWTHYDCQQCPMFNKEYNMSDNSNVKFLGIMGLRKALFRGKKWMRLRGG